MKGNTMAKDNVRIVRLTTGEEIICKADAAEDGGWFIKDALLLVPVSLQNLSMLPWLAYADAPEEGIHIPEKIVAFTVLPQKRLKAEYEKAFSKIIAPDAGDIIGGADMAALGSKLRLSTE
jgi:hypothetical protein